MSEFHDRIALVTGAASGIGLAVSKILAARGATVWGMDVEDSQTAWEALATSGGLLRGDVSKEEDWAAVLEKLGSPFDVLVNAAGINGVTLPGDGSQGPDKMNLDTWRRVMAVNVDGIMIGCKRAIPYMRDSGGSIVNISSIAAQRGWPSRSAYGASKAAVLQYTKSVARYCAGEGWAIRCNAVLPGPIDTPMLRPVGTLDLIAGGDGREGADHVPMARYGDPEEVAWPIIFLASDRASYITGIGLPVDGGIVAKTAVI